VKGASMLAIHGTRFLKI